MAIISASTVFISPDDRHINVLILANLCRVNIDMDHFCMRCEGFNLSGNTVVEPCADGDQEIAFSDREVCIFSTVHPQHAKVERVITGNTTDTHKGGRDRDTMA